MRDEFGARVVGDGAGQQLSGILHHHAQPRDEGEPVIGAFQGWLALDECGARADGSLRNLLARLARIDVLVIDDWAMPPL